jgi:hypothetical protein
VENDTLVVPCDQNDVVKNRGTIFDQREHWTAARELAAKQRLVAVKARHGPPVTPKFLDEGVSANAGRAAIDQVGERFGGDASFAPVAKHHCSGGAATQQLGLRDVGNVEKSQRVAAFALRRKVECLRRDQRAAAQGEGPHRSIDGDDNQDQHQQGNDDQRRRDDHSRLATGQCLLGLTSLRRHLRQLRSIKRCDGAFDMAKVDSDVSGNRLNLGTSKQAQYGFAIGRTGSSVLLHGALQNRQRGCMRRLGVNRGPTVTSKNTTTIDEAIMRMRHCLLAGNCSERGMDELLNVIRIA